VSRVRALVLALIGAAVLGACTPKANLIVVLPEEGGKVGSVVVKDRQGATAAVLDKPYAAAGASEGSTSVQTVEVDQAEVQEIFGTALAAQPIPPADFTLYFESDSNVLTPQSQAAFEGVFQDIARRKAAEVVATGNTDTMGDLVYNDGLSRQRAEAVRDLLVARGIRPEDIVVAGRGERELLVPTPDETPEARNRRVIITVR
jgi:OmpA-OmpF porin, OOP family